jgi:hypothetical protein
MSAQTLDFKRQPLKEMSGIFSTNLKKISRTGEEDTTLWRLALVSSQMRSEAVGKCKEKKRRAPDAPHTSHDVVSQEHGYGAGAAAQEFELAEMRRKKKKTDGEDRNLPREERKMRAIMQRIDNACDTGGGEAAAQGPRGEGEYSSSRHKTATAEHNQGGFNGKGKEEAVEKITIPVPEPEASSLARQHKQGEGGSRGLEAGAGGGSVRKKCPHNRQRSRCKECGGSGICEHNRQRSVCNLCGGSGICKHSRVKAQCKQCDGSGICEHNRQRSVCKLCGGSSICKHNRRRSVCKQCGGSSLCQHNRDKKRCKQCGANRYLISYVECRCVCCSRDTTFCMCQYVIQEPPANLSGGSVCNVENFAETEARFREPLV